MTERKTITLAEFCVKRQRICQQYTDRFRTIFHKTLKDFYDNLFGIDVIELDYNLVKPRENESTKEAIIRKWGQAGADLIDEILAAEAALSEE